MRTFNVWVSIELQNAKSYPVKAVPLPLENGSIIWKRLKDI